MRDEGRQESGLISQRALQPCPGHLGFIMRARGRMVINEAINVFPLPSEHLRGGFWQYLEPGLLKFDTGVFCSYLARSI